MSNQLTDGPFAPLTEEYTLHDLPVRGTIPAHLDGRYLRNGPNPITEIAPALHHLFGGDGMVHGLRIRDGKAEWYRNRWVRSPLAAQALGERPPAGPFRVSGLGANTNIIGHAGRTLALVESGVASYEMTEHLDTVGVCDFDGKLTGGYTAHPKRDPVTGELHAVSYSMNRGNRVEYSVIDVNGHPRRIVDIEVTGSPMMHDFSLTDRYVIFYDLPVTFDATQAAAMTTPYGLRWATRLALSAAVGRIRIPDPVSARLPKPPGTDRRFPYSWDENYPARIGVMPRDGNNSDVRWIDVEPCYVFHPVNAYDDGETIVLDVVRHPKMFDRSTLVPCEGAPTLDRWTVDLRTGTVNESRLDDRAQEFPRIDDRLIGKPHRYTYVPALGADAMSPGDTLFKHDLVGNNTLSRQFGLAKTVGEFVFQPTGAGAGEDEGVLLGYVHDQTTDRSELAVLDAQTLDDIAAIALPHRVPVGFHGNWIPTDDH